MSDENSVSMTHLRKRHPYVVSFRTNMKNKGKLADAIRCAKDVK